MGSRLRAFRSIVVVCLMCIGATVGRAVRRRLIPWVRPLRLCGVGVIRMCYYGGVYCFCYFIAVTS